MAVRTWVWVVVGALGLMAVGCVALVGTGAYLAMRHMQIESTPRESAAVEFDHVRARFEGSRPLIEVEGDDMERVRINHPPATAPKQAVRNVNLLVWSPDEDKLVRLSLPLWLLRFNTGGFHVTTRDGDLSFERFRLQVEDIERHGPGLVLDHESRRGERVLIWAE
jgi:hypothetical protein